MSKKLKEQTTIEAMPVVVEETANLPVQHQESLARQFLDIVTKASTDTRCNVDKMRALLDMQKEMVAEERRVQYSQSMRAAQAEMEPVVRKSQNDHTKSKYAKLEHIDKVIRPIYTKHGFSLSFDTRREEDGTVTAICSVLHDSGHTERKELNGAVDSTGAKGTANKTAMQGVGSTVSYLRRYLTCMIFNIVLVNEDDDGTGGKREIANDRFAGQAAEQTVAPKLSLEEAAAALKDKLLGAKTMEKRGEIFIRNVKIIETLDAEDRADLSNELREIAERNPEND